MTSPAFREAMETVLLETVEGAEPPPEAPTEESTEEAAEAHEAEIPPEADDIPEPDEGTEEVAEPEPEEVAPEDLGMLADDNQAVDVNVLGEVTRMSVAQLKARVQKGDAAEKRLQEAATQRASAERQAKEAQALRQEATKEVETARNFWQQFKQDPLNAFLSHATRELGDQGKAEELLKQIVTDKAWEYVSEQEMSPEQQELLQERKKSAAYEKRLREIEENQKRQAQQAQVQTIRTQIDAQVSDAINAVKLPRDPEVVKMVANEMLMAHRSGIALTARDAAANVKQRLPDRVAQLAAFLSADELTKRFPDLVARLRKADVKEVTEKKLRASTLQGRAAKPTQPDRRESPKRVTSASQYRKLLADRLRSG
jgi:hypothetical protein